MKKSYKHFKGAAVLFSLLLTVCVSNRCSVKEDRTPCLCYLDVDMTALHVDSSLDTSGSVANIRIFTPEACIVTDAVEIHDSPAVLTYMMERISATVCVTASDAQPSYEGAPWKLTVPEGRQADSLYAFVATADCDGDEAYIYVRPQKQFSTVTVRSIDGGVDSWRFILRGSWCGTDIRTMEPVEGAYSFDMRRKALTSARIPRQGDGSLRLEIYDASTGQYRFDVNIGRMLLQAGYPSTKEALPDYDLDINLDESFLKLTVVEWEEEFVFDII